MALATCIPSRARTNEVRRELSHHGEDVEQQSADRIRGSWIEPPMLSLTPFAVSSSTMSLASRSDRARRSSLATTRVSSPGTRPERRAAWALPIRSSQPVVYGDVPGIDTWLLERVALRGQVSRTRTRNISPLIPVTLATAHVVVVTGGYRPREGHHLSHRDSSNPFGIALRAAARSRSFMVHVMHSLGGKTSPSGHATGLCSGSACSEMLLTTCRPTSNISIK